MLKIKLTEHVGAQALSDLAVKFRDYDASNDGHLDEAEFYSLL